MHLPFCVVVVCVAVFIERKKKKALSSRKQFINHNTFIIMSLIIYFTQSEANCKK